MKIEPGCKGEYQINNYISSSGRSAWEYFWKVGQIEIQGDQRAEVARILAEAGFRPVMAGG